MKKSTFILIGMVLTVLAILVMGCGSPSQQRAEGVQVEQGMSVGKSGWENAAANTMEVKYNSNTSPLIYQHVGNISNHIYVYKFKAEGKVFLLVQDHFDGGMVIHELEDGDI